MTKRKVEQQSIINRVGRKIDGNLLYATGFCVLMALLGVIGLPTLWLALAAIVMLTVRQQLRFSLPVAGITALIILVVSHFSWMAVLPIFSTLLVAEMYQKRLPIMLIYEIITLFIIAAIIMLHLIFPDIAAWWLSYFAPIQKMILADKTVDPTVIKQTFSSLSEVATGIMGVSVLMTAMISLILGLMWSDKLNHTKKTLKELREVHISLVLLVVSAFGLLAWFIRFKWMVDILPVIIGAISLYGINVFLCVIWYLFAKSIWVYIVLFATLFLFIQFTAIKMMLILLAVSDYFVDWRSIFKRVTTAKPN